MRTCAEIANGTQIIDADWGGEEGECLGKSILSFASTKHLCIHKNQYCPYRQPIKSRLNEFSTLDYSYQ